MTSPTPAPHPLARPMTCAECLGLVATADVAELTTATAITEHCRTCADCAAVVDAVADEASRFAELLDGVSPGEPPHVVALRAAAGSARARRRRTARRWVAGGAGALLLAVGAMAVGRRVVPTPRVTETVLLRCLSTSQLQDLAAAALPPALLETVTLSFRSRDPVPMVRVSGPPAAVAAAEQRLQEIDAVYGPRYGPSCQSGPDAAATAAAERAAQEAAMREAMAAEEQAKAAAKAAAKADMDAAKGAAKAAKDAAKAAAKAAKPSGAGGG